MIPQIFLDCCGYNEGRIDLRTPFEQDGYVCATNGHIAVRTLVKHFPTDVEIPARNLPRVSVVFAECKANQLHPLPDIPEPEPQRCDICNGMKTIQECTMCLGNGDHECDCGDFHECHHCNGTGIGKGKVVECRHCQGTGVEEPKRKAVQVGPMLLANHYVWLLRRHGIYTVMTDVSDENRTMASFQIGDIEGVVCGMRAGSPMFEVEVALKGK